LQPFYVISLVMGRFRLPTLDGRQVVQVRARLLAPLACHRDEVLLGAFIKNRIPVAVLYGGGSNRQPEFTARLHHNTIATAKKIASIHRGL
jgi:hypothetical protein